MESINLSALIAALERRDRLSEEEKAELAGLDWRVRHYEPGSEIIVDGSRPTMSCLVLDGFAARALTLASGDRQIAAVHLAGDFVDLHGLFLKVMDHAVIALTGCTVAFARHSAITDLTARRDHLGRLLGLLVALDAAIQRAWIASLGRRDAEGRLAHLICELHLRLAVVGQAAPGKFRFPIKQEQLADILGISHVHTNRTVQALREMGLVAWREGTITVLDEAGLRDLAQFDETYLNLFEQPR